MPYRVSLMPPEWDQRQGFTELWVDTETGEFVNGWSGDDPSPIERLKTGSVAWHEDMGLGWFGEVLVFLSGIALHVLYVTGFVLWWKRAGKRRKEHSERKERIGRSSHDGSGR